MFRAARFPKKQKNRKQTIKQLDDFLQFYRIYHKRIYGR